MAQHLEGYVLQRYSNTLQRAKFVNLTDQQFNEMIEICFYFMCRMSDYGLLNYFHVVNDFESMYTRKDYKKNIIFKLFLRAGSDPKRYTVMANCMFTIPGVSNGVVINGNEIVLVFHYNHEKHKAENLQRSTAYNYDEDNFDRLVSEDNEVVELTHDEFKASLK